MRPSDRPKGEVWRVLSAWAKAHPLKPKQTQWAGLFGVSDSLVSNWKYMDSQLQTDDMMVISEKTGIEIEMLAEAARADLPTVLENVHARRSKARPPRRSREQSAD